MTGRRGEQPRARVLRVERRRAHLAQRWHAASSAWVELLVAWDYFRAVVKACPDAEQAARTARAAAGDLVRRAEQLTGEEKGAAA